MGEDQRGPLSFCCVAVNLVYIGSYISMLFLVTLCLPPKRNLTAASEMLGNALLPGGTGKFNRKERIEKVTGRCPIGGDVCTDIHGRHHTITVQAETIIEAQYIALSKIEPDLNVRITRVEIAHTFIR